METIKVYPKGVKTVGRSGRVGLPPGAGGRRGKIRVGLRLLVVAFVIGS